MQNMLYRRHRKLVGAKKTKNTEEQNVEKKVVAMESSKETCQ